MSAIVAAVIGLASLLLGLPLVFTIIVVNFVGGYIPYIGAFLGGGLAVIVALGDGGFGEAAVMLVVVLAANLLLENFIEPKVMGRTLDIHPLIVLVVTALGGVIGGIVGLILAVPFFPSLATPSPAFDLEASSSRSPTAPSRPCDTYSNDVGCSAHARRNRRLTSRQRPIHAGHNSVGTGFTTYVSDGRESPRRARSLRAVHCEGLASSRLVGLAPPQGSALRCCCGHRSERWRALAGHGSSPALAGLPELSRWGDDGAALAPQDVI